MFINKYVLLINAFYEYIFTFFLSSSRVYCDCRMISFAHH